MTCMISWLAAVPTVMSNAPLFASGNATVLATVMTSLLTLGARGDLKLQDGAGVDKGAGTRRLVQRIAGAEDAIRAVCSGSGEHVRGKVGALGELLILADDRGAVGGGAHAAGMLWESASRP